MMAQGGLFTHWQRKHNAPDKCKILREQSTASRPMTLSDMLALFIILAIGIVSAFLTLLGELAWRNICKITREKTPRSTKEQEPRRIEDFSAKETKPYVHSSHTKPQGGTQCGKMWSEFVLFLRALHLSLSPGSKHKASPKKNQVSATNDLF